MYYLLLKTFKLGKHISNTKWTPEIKFIKIHHSWKFSNRLNVFIKILTLKRILKLKLVGNGREKKGSKEHITNIFAFSYFLREGNVEYFYGRFFNYFLNATRNLEMKIL